jgi:cobalamin biosynthesis protein CobW
VVRPGTGLLWTRHGRIDPAFALGLGIGAEDDLASRRSHHDDGLPHDHDDFASFVLEVPPVADPAPLIQKLAALIPAFDVLREKGFLAVAGKPMRHVVQAVGPRIEHYYDRPGRSGEPGAGALVFIGETSSSMAPEPIRARLLG